MKEYILEKRDKVGNQCTHPQVLRYTETGSRGITEAHPFQFNIDVIFKNKEWLTYTSHHDDWQSARNKVNLFLNTIPEE